MVLIKQYYIFYILELENFSNLKTLFNILEVNISKRTCQMNQTEFI